MVCRMMKKILYYPKGKTATLKSTYVNFGELFSFYKVVPPIDRELRKAMGRESAILDATAGHNTGVHDTFDIILRKKTLKK